MKNLLFFSLIFAFSLLINLSSLKAQVDSDIHLKTQIDYDKIV